MDYVQLCPLKGEVVCLLIAPAKIKFACRPPTLPPPKKILAPSAATGILTTTDLYRMQL